MYSMISLTWLLIGGLLEPVWLLALKKCDNFRHKGYTVLAGIMMFVSPLFLSFSMKEIPVGIAYAAWTGIGAICAVGLGALLFKERITPKTALYVGLIVIGAIGLAMAGDI